MKRTFLLMILITAIALYAQNYFEASGQTVAFRLAAGEKAGWNKNALARIPHAARRSSSSFTITKMIDRYTVSFTIDCQYKQQPLAIAIFRLDGHLIKRVSSAKAGKIAFNPPLPNGCYWLRLESNNKAIATTRLCVTS